MLFRSQVVIRDASRIRPLLTDTLFGHGGGNLTYTSSTTTGTNHNLCMTVSQKLPRISALSQHRPISVGAQARKIHPYPYTPELKKTVKKTIKKTDVNWRAVGVVVEFCVLSSQNSTPTPTPLQFTCCLPWSGLCLAFKPYMHPWKIVFLRLYFLIKSRTIL